MLSTGHQVVVITGASSGVGRATAHAFARQGANLALIARNQEALEKTLDEVRSLGGSGKVYPLDVSDFQAVDDVSLRIERDFGPISVWINNAMVSIMSPLEQITAEEFRRVTEVTYLGYVWGTQTALRRMRPRKNGVIVQVGSALAHRSIPLQSAYCGAKHAIAGMTESLRCELIHEKSGVRVTMVDLPGVNTPQFNWVRNKMGRKSKPVGTIFEPEVAARAILWASRHARKEVYLGWPTVESVLGNRVIPSLLDHYLARKVYREHLTKEPDPRNSREDNLFHPVHTDYGTRGPYCKESRRSSWQFKLDQNRNLIGALLAGVVLTLIPRILRRTE